MSKDLQQQLEATLGSAYTLDRELGGGGMSRVFVAEDTALGRKVVVKVLQPELAAAVSLERFNREIQVAARLQHPNIVPVLSAGASDGLPYYMMPFVEGESLRSRLARSGALPVSEAVRILRDVAEALSYSHERGIVHRDIKPDNVLLTRHHALVADFGVAKALSASSEDQRIGALTTLGVALGTPAYMAPEQVAADPTVDHRADLYALGAVAYEMLAGEPVFGKRSPSALLAAHITEQPVQLDERRPDVPPPLAELVMRLLEKNRDDRPQSADEVLSALDSVATPSGDTTSLAAAAFGRRRLWLAAAVYTAALLAVVGLAKLATDQLGLPDWVLPGSILVMALILPLVALTAFAHYTTHAHRSPAATLSGTRTPRSSGARLAQVARRWLTWRRTVRGGALALTLFAAVVAGHSVLRALGIGPAGSLVAAGVLGERDPILISDFRATGRDSLLGQVVTEALRTDLAQSRVVTVVQPSTVRGVLARMRRAPDTPIDPLLAREIATREGIKGVIEGDVRAVGGGYLLTARLVTPETGDVLAAFRETADDQREIIRAIDRLSRRLRGKIGESLKTIRATQPLDRVTTSSLEALRKYSQGVHAMDLERDNAKSIALLEEAVRLDTTFAMAYRKLGVAYQREGTQPAKQFAMVQKAFDFRDRLPDVERYLAIGSYYGIGPHFDIQKALAAYEALLEIDPQNPAALNNAALLYQWRRDFPRAVAYLRRAAAADSTNAFYLGNLFEAQMTAGILADARATLALERARFPDYASTPLHEVALAAVEGDYDAAARYAVAARRAHPEDANVRSLTSAILSGIATLHGRLAEGERLSREAAAHERERGRKGSELGAEAYLSFIDAWYRADIPRGRARLEAALRAHPLSEIPEPDRPYLDLATTYAILRQPDRARAMLAQFDQSQRSSGKWEHAGRREVAIGAIALAEERYADAVAAFRAADVGPCTACALPGLGIAYDLAGNADSAIAVFERYLAKPSGPRLYVDVLFLAAIHKRLGELYDARDDKERAAQHYARFVDLWKDADPELRPQVDAARRRLIELRSTEKSRTRISP